MKGKYLFRKLSGIFLTGLGCFMLLGLSVNISKGQEFQMDDALALVLIVIVPIVAGAWLIFSANKKNKEERFEDREREVLRLAQLRKGKLTASELAMNSRFSLQESENILNDLHRRGYALIGNAENGAVIYDFHELLSASEKSRSNNLLD